MAIVIHQSGRTQWTVISVTGDLDVAGAPDLRQAVMVAVADGARYLVLDLSGLDFIDSFGLGVVVGTLKRIRKRRGDLRLVCPVQRIRRVFEMCDLDRIVALYDTLDSAAVPVDSPIA